MSADWGMALAVAGLVARSVFAGVSCIYVIVVCGTFPDIYESIRDVILQKWRKNMNQQNWDICDFVKQRAGKNGMTVADIASALEMSERATRGRISALIDEGYMSRVDDSSPAAYRWAGGRLPVLTKSPRMQHRAMTSKVTQAQTFAVLHTVCVMNQMIRSSLQT